MSDQCAKQLYREYHHFRCTRAGTLEHEGRLYCKQHHPPSKLARKAAAPKCQYVASYGPCSTSVSAGVKYCRFHAEISIPRDVWESYKADTKRLDKLAELTVDVRKVYIETLGWIYLDRASIDAALKDGPA